MGTGSLDSTSKRTGVPSAVDASIVAPVGAARRTSDRPAIPASIATETRRQIDAQLCGRSTRKMAADPHATVDWTAGVCMRTILGPALPRHAEAAVNAALEDTRVVLVNGAR